MESKKALLLLSDTDPFLLKVYTHKFEKELGYQVFTADTSDQLYDLVIKKKPDIIVTDIILRKGSAHDALEKIKKHRDKEISSIPIIILTNLGEKGDIEGMKDMGVTEYLVKTKVSFHDVVDTVRKLEKK